MNPSKTIEKFIADIWNQQAFEKLDDYLHPLFQDFSLPPAFPKGWEGIQKWIQTTGLSFAHHTVIEQQITEGNTTILRIKMRMKHTGVWRGLPPTGKEVSVSGYREFWLEDGKIIAHHALIDGDALEKALLQQDHGCRVDLPVK